MTSQDVLERAGFSAAELWGGSLSRPLADRRRRDRPRQGDAACRHAGDHCARPERLYRLARGSGAAPRRARAPPRRGIARLEGSPRRAGDPGGGQDRFRGSRRSAGNDRHLRFRRRPFAAVLRPRHRLGAPRPPHDRDLASAGPVRGHFRVQLPGRGLVLERRARAGLRRSRHLETVGKDAALGARDDENPRPRASSASAPTRPKASPKSSSADRRSARPWSSPGTCRSSRPPVRPAWARSSARRSRRASADRSWSSAATMR